MPTGHFNCLRRIAFLWAVLAIAWVSPASADNDRVVVMTSYPEEVTTTFERAFERSHPGIEVQIVWKQARDAFAALNKPDQSGVDVYWTPSATNFPRLRELGAFQSLSVDRKALPGRIGRQPLSDAKGQYEAFEVAGYGFAINPSVLKEHKLAVPQTWRALADPAYAGLTALPVPSAVGFSPALYDILLQAEGWSEGWATIVEAGATSQLITHGDRVADAVSSGKAAVAPSVDFFIRSAISNGEPVALVYPAPTAFLPAHVAIMRSAPHSRAASAFVDFLLSHEGQSLLFEPDIARYPVRPDVYAQAPKDTVNPFALPESVTLAYDAELGRKRATLIAALFDVAITTRQEKLHLLWQTIHKAEAATPKSADVARARQLASWVPVDPAQSANPAFLALFPDRLRNAEPQPPTNTEEAWAVALDAKQDEALRLAHQALGTP